MTSNPNVTYVSFKFVYNISETSLEWRENYFLCNENSKHAEFVFIIYIPRDSRRISTILHHGKRTRNKDLITTRSQLRFIQKHFLHKCFPTVPKFWCKIMINGGATYRMRNLPHYSFNVIGDSSWKIYSTLCCAILLLLNGFSTFSPFQNPNFASAIHRQHAPDRRHYSQVLSI